jgi:hypothetical protein
MSIHPAPAVEDPEYGPFPCPRWLLSLGMYGCARDASITTEFDRKRRSRGYEPTTATFAYRAYRHMIIVARRHEGGSYSRSRHFGCSAN